MSVRPERAVWVVALRANERLATTSSASTPVSAIVTMRLTPSWDPPPAAAGGGAG